MHIAIHMFKESILCCKIQYGGIIISGILQWKSCDACCIYGEFSNSLVRIHVAELMVVHNFLTCFGQNVCFY